MKLSIPQIDITENEGFAPDKDIFSRKEFGERLASLAEASSGGLVLAIDARWGEGKSTFVKMWRGYVEHQRPKKIQTIYFDAFANDYQKDPFLALVSEIYTLIQNESEQKKQEFIEKAESVAKTLFRGAIKIGIRSISGGILDGSVLDNVETDISDLLAEQVDQLIKDKLENAVQDKQAIMKFQEYLCDLVAEAERPLVFIIDELDRSRPNFSLELIEQIKHLFSVPGITFLLVLNRTQLEESVKAQYGHGIDASQYLQKFVNLWLTLPRTQNQEHYGEEDHGVKYVRFAIDSMLDADEKYNNSDAIHLLCELVKHLKPSFRDIEQTLSYFALIHNMSKPDIKYYTPYQFIYAFICLMKATQPNIFKKIEIQSIDAESLIAESGISNINDQGSIDYLIRLLRFDFANEEKRKAMLNNGEIDQSDIYRVSTTKVSLLICKWLEEIQIA